MKRSAEVIGAGDAAGSRAPRLAAVRGGSLLAALSLVLVFPVSCRRAERPTPYNVLFISLDTVRQDVLGCYGRRPRHAPGISPSPALDELARSGVRMVDAYAPSSWTLPSHLSMMTGRPPLVHGVETEVGTLDPASPTMAGSWASQVGACRSSSSTSRSPPASRLSRPSASSTGKYASPAP